MLSLFLLTGILLISLTLFIGGWLAVDLVGLLTLAALALTGLITPVEALAGFSSPAVVTVWAMFILSAGLTRTGVAYYIGQPLQYFAHRSETILAAVIMLVASLLSALISTTTVAAILLPTIIDLARRSGHSPSRLLMPLALGCLLGGPFTGISTSTNILATDAMRAAGLEPFGLLDFTPITGAVVAAGILFMMLGGLRLLPQHKNQGKSKTKDLEKSYHLGSHIFTITLKPGSVLAGRTLAESHLGSALHLTVVGLKRNGELILAPRAAEKLRTGDMIIVHGQADHLQKFHGSQHLRVEPIAVADLVLPRLSSVRGLIGKNSPLLGKTLTESRLRRQHMVHVLKLESSTGAPVSDLRAHQFTIGDKLILQGERSALDRMAHQGLLENLTSVAQDRISNEQGEKIELASVRVPAGSILTGHSLAESRLGNAFGLTVVALLRDNNPMFMPQPDELVQAGDLLVVQGLERDLEVFAGLQNLEISAQSPSLIAELESQQIGMTEVLLSPRTTLAGKTLNDLLFRDHYRLSVLAILRKGQTYRAGLQEMVLKFGDALLVHGPRQNLAALARDPNFLVLDKAVTHTPRLHKAPLATGIVLAVLASAMLGLAPISVTALAGVVAMALTGCLSLAEAYRTIDWKIIILIASMLPLGVAIQNTGAAQMGAEVFVAMVGNLGPRGIVAALFAVTALGAQIVPPSALFVLMTPVAFSVAESLAISPHLVMMTVALASSASFASPLSHPANLLVMGPGGYKFMDYIKVGLPLAFIAWAVSVWLLPIFWPA